MAFERIRVLIWGKTYPELSSKYTETVCTGGVREDGRPVRLYPVRLRYLEGEQRYKLYEWIDVPVQKSTKDPRPESYRVDPDKIERRGVVGTDSGSWQTRRSFVFRDPSWHFASMAELKEAQARTGRSIGMIKPGVIEDVELIAKPESERATYEEKSRRLAEQKRADLFDPEYKNLEYLPNEIRLHWRCAERCSTCRNRPHAMKVLDWGLLQLARKENWGKAVDRLVHISDLRRHDFRLYLGTFRLHPKNFGVIGLWYPKIPDQPSLFSLN